MISTKQKSDEYTPLVGAFTPVGAARENRVSASFVECPDIAIGQRRAADIIEEIVAGNGIDRG